MASDGSYIPAKVSRNSWIDHGIVTGLGKREKNLLVLRHLERQKKQLGLPIEEVALDRGYDTGAIHRRLELLGITGYIPAIHFPDDPSKYGFSGRPQQDTFICPVGQASCISPAELQ